MTLAIAICTGDGILLAADGRVSRREFGDHLRDTDGARKIHQFDQIGIAATGFKGLTDELLELLRQDATFAACRDVREAQAAAGAVFRSYMTRFNACRQEYVPPGSFLLAGYRHDGVPGVYCMHYGVSFQAGNQATIETVGNPTARICTDTLAHLMFEKGFNCDLTLTAAKVFALTAINFANRITDDVGPPNQMVVITPDGGYRDISDDISTVQQGSVRTINDMRATLLRLGLGGTECSAVESTG